MTRLFEFDWAAARRGTEAALVHEHRVHRSVDHVGHQMFFAVCRCGAHGVRPFGKKRFAWGGRAVKILQDPKRSEAVAKKLLNAFPEGE